jgi:cytoskeletal protein RodZ
MESSIGQKLRNARKDKELTLDQVSKELHIRAAYLKALEEENYQILPSPVQAKGFLKSYADFLHLQIEHNQTPFNGETTAAEIEQNGNQQKISQPDSSEKPSAILFKEIGAELQERREVLGLSRLDIEDHTHIPGHYIEYIESGAFDQFPSPTQARGMLINYINFLNINPDRPMLKYAEALQSDLSVRQASQEETAAKPKFFPSIPKPKLKQPPQWVRMFLSPDLILVSVLGFTIVAMTIWGIGRVNRARTELVPQPTSPSLVEALLPTATNSPTPTATIEPDAGGELLNVDSQPENTAIPFGESEFSTAMQVFIVIRQRTFLKVTIDGEVAYDGRALPGASLVFYGQDSIELLTGDAGALQVYFNDQDQGVLGISGEVKKIIYTQDGVFVPTPLPTATLSPEQLLTPTITSTPNANPILPPAENTPVP